MEVVFRLDLRHWMVGFTFDRYNLMVSVGPVGLSFVNHRKYERDMENYVLEQQNGGRL